MEEIIAMLKEIDPSVDYTTARDLVGMGVLDSMEIVSLITELSDVFSVEISPMDIVPENFDSAASIYGLVCRLQQR